VGTGNLDGLLGLLSEEVTLWADGGGKVRGAATRPLSGPWAVARFVLGSVRFLQGPYAPELTEVNGEPGVILRVEGRPVVVVCFTLTDPAISQIRIIGNPDKLGHLPPPAPTS
jgi:RNA polymerase sigma-70 factor (ECF subfamily)